jgi:sugar-specific transcriptional regulator TrmB
MPPFFICIMLEELQKLGLSDKESLIYLELVKLGESTANSISKETSTNRTVTYNVLQQLIDEGLVGYIKKNGKRYYSVSNPNSLLSPIKEKEVIANDLIKKIKSLNVRDNPSHKVEVYEGVEGMRSIFDKISKAKSLVVLNATGLIFDFLKYSASHIVKDMQTIKGMRVIGNSIIKKSKFGNSVSKWKYFPKEYDNYATTFIFDGCVVIQILTGKPFLIFIESREIYEGYKKDFDLLWKLL